MKKSTKQIVQSALTSELNRYEAAIGVCLRNGKFPAGHVEKLRKKADQIKKAMEEVEAC